MNDVDPVTGLARCIALETDDVFGGPRYQQQRPVVAFCAHRCVRGCYLVRDDRAATDALLPGRDDSGYEPRWPQLWDTYGDPWRYSAAGHPVPTPRPVPAVSRWAVWGATAALACAALLGAAVIVWVAAR